MSIYEHLTSARQKVSYVATSIKKEFLMDALEFSNAEAELNNGGTVFTSVFTASQSTSFICGL